MWDNDGILVYNAKNAILSPSIYESLCTIQNSYKVLVDVLDNLEASKYNMKTRFEAITNLKFDNNTVGIKEYIKMRLAKNDITNLVRSENPNISPSLKISFMKCPPTSIDVERSFSMLKKMLATDRNFMAENIINYFYFYYNTKQTSFEISEEIDQYSNDDV